MLVGGVAFSPAGRTLASVGGNVFDAGFRGEVVLWDVDEVCCIRTLGVRTGAWAVAYDPAGRTLAVGTGGHQLNWYAADLTPGMTLETRTAVRGLAFSPDGANLAVCTGWGVLLAV